MTDLDAAKVEWVREFHSRFYRPNNAVLTLVGGFDSDQALELVRKYFGAADSGDTPPLVDPVVPPQRTTENRLDVLDTNAKTPALLFGWRIPPIRTEDHYALEVAAKVLSDGESAILYDLLVRKKALARDVSVFTYDHRGPDAFIVTVELTENADPTLVEALVSAELRKLATFGPSEEVMARARQRTKSAFVFGLQSNLSRATTLGEYTVFFGNPRLIARDLEALLLVDSRDVKSSVIRYLSPETRTLITVKPVTKQPLTTQRPDPLAQTANSASTVKETR
jgi:predicted Zn-dependent peptidase